jgi:hypothetical protein
MRGKAAAKKVMKHEKMEKREERGKHDESNEYAKGGMVMKSKRKSVATGVKVGQSIVAAVQTKGWGKARKGR